MKLLSNFLLFIAIIPASCNNTANPDESISPNIVIILADDMGYSDIGCYGSEIRTPNIDKLAREGVRFTQFYNAGRCCPSRASLLTGLYSHRSGIGHMDRNYGHPSYRGFLNDSCLTLAEALNHAGYASYMVGKWHVGTEKQYWPLQRGFDKFYGSNTSQGHYFRILNGRKLIYNNRELGSVPDGWYATDAFTDSAVSFIHQHQAQQPDNPFLLYVAYTAPHWPLHALPNDIAMYENTYLNGYDSIRHARYKKMQESGIIQENWKLSPLHERVPDWKSVNNVEEDRRMAVYAAMIHRMDVGIGKISDALKELGIEENTLVMFLSDNGGCAETPGNWYPQTPGAEIGTPESYVGVRLPWANVNNTPYRLFKKYVHEGGISTPLVMKYPEKMNTGGKIVCSPGHIIDIMPTVLSLSGVDYNNLRQNKSLKTLDGISIFPLNEYKTKGQKRTFFWEHEGNRALRKGNYKLVSTHGNEWELYDLSIDRTERNDLSKKFPVIKRELQSTYDEWAETNQVLPFDSVKTLRKKSIH